MAGQIPQRFIDDLLTRVDIIDIIDSRVPLKKTGSNYKACCPFHNEKTPSFTVSPDKQFYHCFGCGAHGTAIGFLINYERFSFPEAIESLAQTIGIDIPYENIGNEQQQSEAQTLYALNKQANQLYQTALRNNQSAIDYLKTRGISGRTAANFAIGYAPQSWDHIISRLGNTEHQRQKLKTAGLAIENDSGKTYDRFRHRITFPIRNRRGNVIGFGGRVLSKDDEPKYLNTPETPIFHKSQSLYGVYELRKFAKNIDYILVVEGYMDVVSLAEHGIDTTVATLGTATTTEHIKQLLRLSEKIIFCFDGDRAGKQAAWRALNNALPALTDRARIRFLFLPDGEDPDSLIKQQGKHAFEALISKAQDLPEYLFAQLAQQADTSQLAGKAKLADSAKPLIQQLNAPLLKELLFNKLSTLIGLPVEKLQTQSVGSSEPTQIPRKTQNRLKLEMNDVRFSISALLQQPALAKQIHSLDALQQLEQPGIDLLCNMITTIQQTPDISPQALQHRYIDTEYEKLLAKLRASFIEVPRDEKILQKEFHDTAVNLMHKARDQRYQVLLHKMNNKTLTGSEREELSQFMIQK